MKYILNILNDENEVEIERTMQDSMLPRIGETIQIISYRGPPIEQLIPDNDKEKRCLEESIAFHNNFVGYYKVFNVIYPQSAFFTKSWPRETIATRGLEPIVKVKRE